MWYLHSAVHDLEYCCGQVILDSATLNVQIKLLCSSLLHKTCQKYPKKAFTMLVKSYFICSHFTQFVKAHRYVFIPEQFHSGIFAPQISEPAKMESGRKSTHWFMDGAARERCFLSRWPTDDRQNRALYSPVVGVLCLEKQESSRGRHVAFEEYVFSRTK